MLWLICIRPTHIIECIGCMIKIALFNWVKTRDKHTMDGTLFSALEFQGDWLSGKTWQKRKEVNLQNDDALKQTA